jgi:hypothetical protein
MEAEVVDTKGSADEAQGLQFGASLIDLHVIFPQNTKTANHDGEGEALDEFTEF